MGKILIVTDSASDISYEDEARYGIRVLPFQIELGGRSYTTRIDFDNEQFYKMLEADGGFPATSQITPFAFEGLYAECLQAGYEDVILVLINALGSATYQNAVQAIESFYRANPSARERLRIRAVDGRSYTCAYGYAVVEGARRAAAGEDADAIYDFICDWVRKSIIYAGLYTLKYAARSGRIPSAAAFVGDAIGMKPLMRICDGAITTRDRVRGEKNIIPFLVRKAREESEPGAPYVVVYGSDPALRDQLLQALPPVMGAEPAAVYQIGAAIAANAGPRVCGVMFRRK